MRVMLTIICMVAVLSPPAAQANGKTPRQIGEPVPATTCFYGGSTYADSTFYAIPDCGSAVAMGPIRLDPWATASDVVVAVNMQHTWIGDINLSLQYDANCDGVAETTSTLMCRTGMLDPSCPSTGCCGCSDDINGTYVFADQSTSVVLGDPFSPCYGGSVAPGCYRPVTPLSAFAGNVGGCWTLVAQDGACGDLFYVNSWTLYFGGIGDPSGACCFDNGTCQSLTSAGCQYMGGVWQGRWTACVGGSCPPPSATVPSTWGGVKHAIYR